MKKAMYPGSFDPITNGHLDIIERAARVFGHLTVAVMINNSKNFTFSVDERVELIKKCTSHLDNVNVITADGLTVDLAKKIDANVLVRGIRAVIDYEHELQIANINMLLDNSIETLFFLARSEYSFISSSISKEIAVNNGDLSKFIPRQINDIVVERLKR